MACNLKRIPRSRKSVFEMLVETPAGLVRCRWWNAPYLKKKYHKAELIMVFGRLVQMNPVTLEHPETEKVDSAEDNSLHMNRIVPIYPLTDGLKQRALRELIWKALHQLSSCLQDFPKLEIPGIPGMNTVEALLAIHFPDELPDALKARQYLAFQEFLVLQLDFARRRAALHSRSSLSHEKITGKLCRRLIGGLSFVLTPSQQKVLDEIKGDIKSTVPMRRLLQGDVGSGKTVVSAGAICDVIESGYNVVLMAPTEILALQHFRTFSQWFTPLGIDVRLYTAQSKSTEFFEKSNLVVGTHALFEAGFQIDRLGLVIIDEQHRFGVGQRERLLRKGKSPHLLIMTATPIPRTLGLTLYGDLDLSRIEGQPSGRGRIRTFIRSSSRLPRIIAFVKTELEKGRQAYFVFPRIDQEDAVSGLKAVEFHLDPIRSELEPHRVELLHGALSSEDSESVIDEFRAGGIKVLLSTTVVEVGVDVPNASIMLIHNGEQFGLAQLHQLRGRIGRGVHDSVCIVVTDKRTSNVMERLQAFSETTDGFKLADLDMKMRGAGEFLGQKQSGLPSFIFGDLVEDADIVLMARKASLQLLRNG
jgi:ATP-dependent DNA helicase RecG